MPAKDYTVKSTNGNDNAVANRADERVIEKCLRDVRLFISSENGLLSSDDRGLIINKKLSKVTRLINKLPSDIGGTYKNQIKLIKATPKRIENSKITSNMYLYPSIVPSADRGDDNYWCYRRMYGSRRTVKYIFFRRIYRSDIQFLKETNTPIPKGKFVIGRAFSRQKPLLTHNIVQ